MSDTMLFISSGEGRSPLEEVAAGVFRALGLSQTEERYSLNYPPDSHYFAGYAENACVEVYDADEDSKPDFPFRVSVKKAWRSGDGTVETDSRHMARVLASAGFHVFIPHGDWHMANWDGAGDLYAP